MLAGHYPLPTHLLSKDPKQFVALQRFCALMGDLNAGPKAHNCYLREAWISPTDNSVRVTMDRKVMISPEFTTRFTAQMDAPVCVFGPLVVLELKFTGRFPDWFKELVRIFNLRQCSASKYADGIALKGEHHFYPPDGMPPAHADPSGAASREERLARLDNLLSKAA